MNDLICGLDEAGRGALAGPLVAAAVVLPQGWSLEHVNPDVPVRDSKKLSIRHRERLFEIIEDYAQKIEIEVISVAEINDHGINWANKEAFRRLISRVDAAEYIVDGNFRVPNLGEKAMRVRSLVRADETIPAVMSAGIVAKVKRDRIMQDLHLQYPYYGWNTNTGHGTQKHIAALRRHGSCMHHRSQFVATALSKPPS
jgi:ribonuclease HII